MKKMEIGEAFFRLFRAWFLILAFWAAIGWVRYQQRARWLEDQTLRPAVATVQSVERRSGKRARPWDYVYQYTAEGQAQSVRSDAREAPQVGEQFEVEYVVAEPALHRRKGAEFGMEIMGLTWILGLALTCSTHVMGYFFWLLKRI